MTLKQIVEALVFASQKPLTPKEIVSALRSAAEMSEDERVLEIAKSKEADVTAALDELREEYETLERSFHLIEEVAGWRLLSKPDYGLWVRQLYPENRPARLSAPALETLAIVAYRQPITKADIEAVRGVAVDGVLQTLLDRALVKIAGRAEIAGRPLLYETTQHFLEHFGLKSTDDLPNAQELKRIILPKAETPAESPAAEVQTEDSTASVAAEEGASEPVVESVPEIPEEVAETVESEENTSSEDEGDSIEPEQADANVS